MEQTQPMGVGKIASPETQFVRKFRFTLECCDYDDNTLLDDHYFKKVDIDFARSQLNFQAYEVVFDKDADDMPVQAWLDKDDHSRDFFIFTTFTGTGDPIYQYRFFDPVVIRDNVSFNYKSSKESVRNVSVKFEEYERTFLHNGKVKQSGPLKKKYIWKLRLENRPEVTVDLLNRPNLIVKEIPINHLNGKHWIPGKTKWQPLTITLPKDHDECGVLEMLLKREPLEFYLDLYTRDGNTKLESWKIKDAVLSRIGDQTPVRFQVIFSNVEYKHAAT